MDGTKPAMESNAEETQDEGQESKGTLNLPLSFACFSVSICVCASRGGLTYLQWLLACARHNSDAFFLASHLFGLKKNVCGRDYSHNPERNLTFCVFICGFTRIWTLMGGE